MYTAAVFSVSGCVNVFHVSPKAAAGCSSFWSGMELDFDKPKAARISSLSQNIAASLSSGYGQCSRVSWMKSKRASDDG